MDKLQIKTRTQIILEMANINHRKQVRELSPPSSNQSPNSKVKNWLSNPNNSR